MMKKKQASRPSGGRLEKQVILIWEKNMTYTKPKIIAYVSMSDPGCSVKPEYHETAMSSCYHNPN